VSLRFVTLRDLNLITRKSYLVSCVVILVVAVMGVIWAIPEILTISLGTLLAFAIVAAPLFLRSLTFRKSFAQRFRRPDRPVPADWRERFLALLSSGGVTQVPHVTRGKLLHGFLTELVVSNVIPIGIYIVATLYFVIALTGWRAYLFTFSPIANVSIGLLLVGAAVLLLVCKFFIGEPFKRRFTTDWLLGRNASRAVEAARQPPILFLRSFSLDAFSSQPLKRSGGSTTPEMALVMQAARFAPVIAIGKPGEAQAPPGAIRIYVTQEQWVEKVREIIALCQLVIWTAGYTEGLQWEIQELVNTVPPGRLLVWLRLDVGDATPEMREREWKRFATAYSRIFPKELPAELGKMHYLAFDHDWTAFSIPGPDMFPLREYLKIVLQ
jgi:hypothetical protein